MFFEEGLWLQTTFLVIEQKFSLVTILHGFEGGSMLTVALFIEPDLHIHSWVVWLVRWSFGCQWIFVACEILRTEHRGSLFLLEYRTCSFPHSLIILNLLWLVHHFICFRRILNLLEVIQRSKINFRHLKRFWGVTSRILWEYLSLRAQIFGRSWKTSRSALLHDTIFWPYGPVLVLEEGVPLSRHSPWSWHLRPCCWRFSRPVSRGQEHLDLL